MDKVHFLPDNVVVYVERGTTLLSAAIQAGIELKSNCGGEGTCGHCLVRVREGEPLLACQAAVNGDMVVEIPVSSRNDEHQVLLGAKEVLTEKEDELLNGYLFKPLCRKVKLTLTEPSLSENVSDLTRLQSALRGEIDCDNINIGLAALRTLPGILRAGDWRVTVTIVQLNGNTDIVWLEPGHPSGKSLGLAVDIGTTTVVAYLIDLETGLTLSKKGTYNKQSRFGDDVITRIIHATEKPDGLQALQNAVVGTVNNLIAELGSETEIQMVVTAGNTTMTHLLLGLTPKYIRLEPYVPLATHTPPVNAADLGLKINPNAIVTCLPCVASYVGGDIVSGLLSTDITNKDEINLFIDIGTNGEIVLGNKDWLITAACSAGPSFEGGGITFGMRAMKGAIERVNIKPENYEVELETIGQVKPTGICGSGLINCLAKFHEVGIIDRAGKMQADINTPRLRKTDEGTEFVLVWGNMTGCSKDIVLTENDIKNLLRAKAAVYAGIRCLLGTLQLSGDVIDRVMIAGGFGNFINIKDAIAIGLLPDLPLDKFTFLGNSAVKGARLSLLSQEAYRKAQELVNKITYIELSSGNDFMDEFVSALFIPHTDMGLFPSVK